MGRFYVDLTLTVYADTEDGATNVGEAAAHLIREAHLDEIGDVAIGDVDDDSPASQEG